MGFSCGIVGLPNVGKSTIFNALTSGKAASENFPFCTIEPNTGAVPVPDPRLQKLADVAKSAKIIPTQMTFVDIAGLIRGASKGEGLGNQFLGHIRSVDAVIQVVRCFSDDNVIHVEGSVDPIRDVETIETELALSDLETVQRQNQKYQKLARGQDKVALRRKTLLEALEAHLGEGQPARLFAYEFDASDRKELFEPLLTSKPTLFVGNVNEEEAALEPDPNGTRPIDRLAKYAQSVGSDTLAICGKIESEIAELPREERQEYLTELGIELSGLDRLTLAGYNLLELLTFFTVGPKEAHAWTAKRGSTAPQAAGKIHTDFEKGFIRAEVIHCDDYLQYKGEAGCRDAGKLRVEGKDYLVQDGDVVHFRFNV
ncbi:MAG: redox-regulated ATPase YchF [Bdellovibrionales bacterium]|nr:redox-regulated ATPase YchF [Bdellovibrionales bacterium]